MKVLVLFGTRPEVIKLAPVIRELRSHREQFQTRIVSTGQHREMVHQALDAFSLKPDVELDAMSAAKTLAGLTARLFQDLDEVIASEAPDWLLVQGDTTSAMAGAMCGFYRQVRVGHVEAGLRTFHRFEPFPEEINRTIIGHVADAHFAPTSRAAENLARAGVSEKCIFVTGNTAVDALLSILERIGTDIPAGISAETASFVEGKKTVLVTGHRRESFGPGLENICRALRATVERYEDAVIVFPVHLNPKVRMPVHRLLGGHPRIRLIEPVGYVEQVWLMSRCFCIFTDSGGIQEEAPSLGKPVLIMRDRTERPEVVEAGCARIVGTSHDAIVAGACDLFDNLAIYESMSRAPNPFGDGRASERIVGGLMQLSPAA